jgi:hypothetical protein
LHEGLAAVQPGGSLDVVIDMDAIADTVPGAPRADFYVASIAQQTRFNCSKCRSFNDVRGKYAYCANCGWRNNLASARIALDAIREDLNGGRITPVDAVKRAVSEFDATGRNFAGELARRSVVMESRRRQLRDQLFHAVDAAEELLRQTFDIRFMRGMDAADKAYLTMMFARRHIYEHDGGVATARYVRDSGDKTVKEGDLVRETVENANRLISGINRMLKALDEDFHQIFPPYDYWIKEEEARKARLAKRRSGG